jgi:addiction module HigA family antidote
MIEISKLERNPMTSPGSLIREVLAADYRSVKEIARALRMSRVATSRLLNGHSGISIETARRLEELGFNTAKDWLKYQVDYELSRGGHD